MLETFKTIGALLGIVAFVWKVWDLFASYLHVAVLVSAEKAGVVSVKTTVENKSLKKKKVDNALLLVGPETENPIDTFNALIGSLDLDQEVKTTNEIAETSIDKAIFDGSGRGVIPLPFFYSENIAIGDECITYNTPIDSTHMARGKPYSVRLFIWVEGRLHRTSHDLILLK